VVLNPRQSRFPADCKKSGPNAGDEVNWQRNDFIVFKKMTGSTQCSVTRTASTDERTYYHSSVPSLCMPVFLHLPPWSTPGYAVSCCRPEYYVKSSVLYSSSFLAFEHMYCANPVMRKDSKRDIATLPIRTMALWQS
jgi:hypothetical protein